MTAPRLHRGILLLAVLIVAALSGAPAASADVGETIIERCTHGKSLAGFSQSDYRKALKELSADAEEYTPCAQLIRQAQLSAASGGGSGAAAAAEAGVPLPATPAEQRALARAAHAGAAPVAVGGSIVHPGVVHANVASALSSLPSSLLATIAFLLACLVVYVGHALRGRFGGNRGD
jgi:hypothetical protein